MKQEFHFSFWNYNAACLTTLEDVKHWADSGATVAMLPHFRYDRDKVEDLKQIIDACADHNMKVILCVEGLEFPFADDEGAYRALASQVYRDFGQHPAVKAVALGDEPSNRNLYRQLEKSIQLVREEMPGMDFHVNFLPYYRTMGDDVLGGEDYLPFMKGVISRCGFSSFSYDCYCQMHYHAGEHDMCGYFTSMNGYAEIAEETGTEWWNTVLSTGHWDYHVPSEDDLRWQLSTSAASGAKGLLWYQFYDSFDLANYHGSPIDEFGNRSATFYAISHVTKLFRYQHGELLANLKLKEIYHFRKAYGGYQEFPSEGRGVITAFDSSEELPAILSFFVDENGEEYVVVVNNSPSVTGKFTFVLDKAKTSRMVRVRENGKRFDDCFRSGGTAMYCETEKERKIAVWLGPGQLEIFKIS
ncbi:putative uncharacterized protein [Candidatus Colimorpha enterica]|uniref:Uncharacterized protein n=1 Tax=Candidatus Colimorpha enterica TaxID=3083063 RepID=R6V2B8_9BACT|nr:putative uncharacterized protein [Candidatus Colimorpha enterica]